MSTVADGEAVLRAAGVATAAADAAALWEHAQASDGGFDALVRRRANHEPLAHIVGRVRFRGLQLQVGPGVFVPQPETEAVVAWAVRAMVEQRDAMLVDLCAGSGALGLAVSDELAGSTVHLVERDPDAFQWLARNCADRAGAHAHLADVTSALPELDGTVDLVLANPPYVAAEEMGSLHREVADYDPATALFGGSDGLAVIRQVAVRAAQLVRPAGLFVVEHSDRQGESVPALLREQGGWHSVADHVDGEGLPRFTSAVRAVDGATS